MKRIQNTIPYYIFEHLEESGLVKHGFTTRHYTKDGEASDFFQPLLRNSSNPKEVADCRRLLALQFSCDENLCVTSAQTHSCNIHEISEEDLLPEGSRRSLSEIDGLITNRPGVMLQTFGADCPSIYLLDPVHKAIGLCHSGRKGTQGHIAVHLLQEMENAYGSRAADILAAISPGICVDCYEVGKDVAKDFRQDYLRSFPIDITEFQHEALKSQIDTLLPDYNGIPHIDLSGAIRLSLETAGVPSNQIQTSPLCTKCRSDIFYSFRAEGKISNENCALLMLKDSATRKKDDSTDNTQ